MQGAASRDRHLIGVNLWPDFSGTLCFAGGVAPQTAISEAELQRWKLIAPFRHALDEALTQSPAHRSFADPRRLLPLAEYLALVLFGLLNPVVRTMRGLCAASHLERVQRQVCARPVSLGSFSETQHLRDPPLLEQVCAPMSAQVHGAGGDPRLAGQPWLIVDSTLWAALPRMHWAVSGGGKAGAINHAVRLHVSFHLWDQKPTRATLTAGQRCERAVWRAQWQAGQWYVGDRYYGEDYRVLAELNALGCTYVLRVRDSARINVAEELPVSEADRAAGVVRQAWATLGAGPTRSTRVRVVWVQTAEQTLRLVTHQAVAELSAELVALVYRYRWQVELFFRWIKCILGCRHWLAESATGVTVQVSLALIAALLLQLYTGGRPSKRMMELIQWYVLGVASVAELTAGVQRELTRTAKNKGA